MASRTSTTALNGTTSAFVYLEKRLAEKLNLSLRDFRYVRREALKKRRDWTIEGRAVVLTEKALARVIEFIRSTSGEPLASDFSDCRLPSPAEKKNGAHDAAPPPDEELQELTVKRIYPNYRLLMATTQDGTDVRVSVMQNKNFRPRMTLKARPIGENHFRMEGRCPRFPGRY